MAKASQNAREKSRPNAPRDPSKAVAHLDNAPVDLDAAARMDLREGRRARPGVQEAIAERLGIDAGSVYKLTSGEGRAISTQHVEEITRATGGAHIRAHLDHLAAAAFGSGVCLGVAAANVVQRGAELNQVVALAQSDGTVTDAEWREIEKMLSRLMASVATMRSSR